MNSKKSFAKHERLPHLSLRACLPAGREVACGDRPKQSRTRFSRDPSLRSGLQKRRPF